MPIEPLEAALPDILHFHPEWFTDPPPWWILIKLGDRFDPRQVINVAKAQVEVKNSVLLAQKTALQAQMKVLDAQIKANALMGDMVGAVKPG